MVQRDRLDAVLLVHNVSDVSVDDVVAAADGGEHPRMMTSSNVTDQRQPQPARRIRLVRAIRYDTIYYLH